MEQAKRPVTPGGRRETVRLKTSISVVADTWRGTMTSKSAYDGSLQMFVEEPRGINVERLRFLRWLAEQGRLEHPVAGPVPIPLGRGGQSSNDDPPLAA